MSLPFSRYERFLAVVAGLFNLVIGIIFFFHLAGALGIWPKETEPTRLFSHFVGAIVLGNAVGAFLLARESDWLRVRPLVVVGMVYGALVAAGLLYEAFQPRFNSFFWGYLAFDLVFEVVFLAIFLRHQLYKPPVSSASQPASKVPHVQT